MANPNELLILSILSSKRLLSEHVEVLEYCYDDYRSKLIGENVNPNNRIEKMELIKSVALIAASSIVQSTSFFNRNKWGFLLRSTLPVIALGYSSQIIWKLNIIFNDGRRFTILNQFLEKLEAFDLCFHRNIGYYREKSLMKTNQLDSLHNLDREIATKIKCIQSIQSVTKSLYEAVYQLETSELPAEYENIYENIEAPLDFSKFMSKFNRFQEPNLKDLYNIFAYIQSQLLTRLGLAIVYNNEMAYAFVGKQVPALTTHLVKQTIINESAHILLNGITKRTGQLQEANLIHNQKSNTISEILTPLKGYSLNFNSRLFAIANECRKLDDFIQTISNSTTDTNNVISIDRKQAYNILEPMKHIQDSINLCQDDYQRLVLTYHKFIYLAFDILVADGTNVDLNNEEHENGEFIDKLIPKFDELLPSDIVDSEFYALAERSEDDEDNDEEKKKKTVSDIDEELQLTNRKIIKQQFKPVLAQLKYKIDPINNAMRDRERKYLQDHGIPTDVMDEDSVVNLNGACGDDNGGGGGSDVDNDNDTQVPKMKKHNNKYDDNRAFLEQKQQISLLPMGFSLPLPKLSLDEDILE